MSTVQGKPRNPITSFFRMLDRELAPEVAEEPRAEIIITDRNIGIKVFDLESIGLKGYRTGITTNIGKFQRPREIQEYPFVLIGVEYIPKAEGLDKASPKWRLNLSPMGAFRHALNMIEAVRKIEQWSHKDTLQKIGMELSP